MNWTEFNQHFIVEVNIEGTMDIEFGINTSITHGKNHKSNKITHAKVINKKTYAILKEYSIEMNSIEMRTVNNELKEFIMNDFRIENREEVHLRNKHIDNWDLEDKYVDELEKMEEQLVG